MGARAQRGRPPGRRPGDEGEIRRQDHLGAFALGPQKGVQGVGFRPMRPETAQGRVVRAVPTEEGDVRRDSVDGPQKAAALRARRAGGTPKGSASGGTYFPRRVAAVCSNAWHVVRTRRNVS